MSESHKAVGADGARRSPSTSEVGTRKFPTRLFHETPPWVHPGVVFHLRVRCDRSNRRELTVPEIGSELLQSVAFYHERQRWWVSLFLLMPDHWHGLISFPRAEDMSRVIGDWKRFQEKKHGIVWQEGYFDHRIRNEAEFQLKADYIRNNPVVKQLCSSPSDWLWVFPKVDGDLRAPLF